MRSINESGVKQSPGRKYIFYALKAAKVRLVVTLFDYFYAMYFWFRLIEPVNPLVTGLGLLYIDYTYRKGNCSDTYKAGIDP